MSASALDALRVSEVLPATPERVFRAWTTPDEVKQWWGRLDDYDVSTVEMDVRVGGTWRVEGSGFTDWAIFGTYKHVSASQRLVYTWVWEAPLIEATDTGESLVTVEFKEVDGGTEVEVVHERLRGPAVVGFHEIGWSKSFERLAALLRDGEGVE